MVALSFSTGSIASTDGATSQSNSYPAGARLAGDILFVVVAASNATAPVTITGPGGIWSQYGSTIQCNNAGSNSYSAIAVFTAIATGPSDPTASFTVNNTSDIRSITVWVRGAIGIDTLTFNSATFTSGTSASVTSSAPARATGELAWCAQVVRLASASTDTYTAGTGFSNAANTGSNNVTTHFALDRKSSISTSVTETDASSWASSIVSCAQIILSFVPYNAPTRSTSYTAYDTSVDTASLVTASFTPAANDLLVVKAVSSDASMTFGTPSGGGLTFTSQYSLFTAGYTGVQIWTAAVGAAPSAMTVTLPVSGTSHTHGMIVERWTGAALAVSPVIISGQSSSGTPSASGTVSPGSAVTFLNADWNEILGARTYLATTGIATETSSQQSDPHYVADWAYQFVFAASQSIGLTAPAGQKWTLAGIELLYGVSSSDSGTGAETGTVAVSDTDAGSGADAGESLHVTLSSSDTGTGIDAGEKLAASSSDTGTGIDAGEKLAASSSDTGTGIDASTSITLNAVDAGTGADASVSITLNAVDAGTAVDAGEKIAVSSADAGTAVDAGEKIAVSSADAGTCVDAGEKIAVSSADAGTCADAGEAVQVTLSSSDASTGADTGTQIAPQMFRHVNSLERLASGTAITFGNSGGSNGQAFDTVGLGSGGAVTADNAHAAHGIVSAKFVTTGAGSAYVNWVLTDSSLTQWFRIYLYITANPSASTDLIQVNTVSNGAAVAKIWINSAGKIFASKGNGTVITTTMANAIPLNQWCRVEGFVCGSASTGQVELKLFSGAEDITPLETQTSAAALNLSGTGVNWYFGQVAAPGSGYTLWIDDFAVSPAGYVGPYGSLASSDADMRTAVDAGEIVTPSAGADAGTGNDAGEFIQATASDADTGTSIDASTKIAPQAGDAGTGSDAGELVQAALGSSTDACSGTDASMSIVVSSADAGTAVDAGSVHAALSSNDTGAGADAGEKIALSSNDAGAGADAGESVKVSSADAGTGLDAGETVTIGGGTTPSDSDIASGLDAGEVVHVTVSSADSGTGADAGSVHATLSASDIATGLDSAVHVTLSSADAGTGLDAGERIALTSADAGTGLDSGSVHVTLSSADVSSGADAGSVHATLSASDIATGLDAGSVHVTLSSADAGSGTDSGTEIALTSADAGTGTDTELGRGLDTSTGLDADEFILALLTGSDAGAGAEASSVFVKVKAQLVAAPLAVPLQADIEVVGLAASSQRSSG